MTEYNDMLAQAARAISDDKPDDLEFALVFPAADADGYISCIGPNFTAHNGIGFLHTAAWLGAEKCAQRLLEMGADPSACDKTGKTPLHMSVWRNMARMTFLLASKGADLDASDSTGMSPLHLAAMSDAVRSADVLVAAGANVDLQDHHGLTPLHWAALKGNHVMTEFLLRHGVNKTIADDAGKTAQMLARERGMDEIAALVADFGRPPPDGKFVHGKPKGPDPR